MQHNLFSSAFPLQEEGICALHAFSFKRAIDCFLEAEELHPELPNNAFYKKLADACLQYGLGENTPSVAIAEFWETVHLDQVFAGETNARTKYLFKICSLRLRELNDFDENGFLQNVSGFFHKSACLMYTEEPQSVFPALVKLLDLKERQIPARYWAWFGDTAHRLRRQRQANLGYISALAIDPMDIDWGTFADERLRALFKKQQSHQDLQQAYGTWPFYAWAEGLIEVPPLHDFFSTFLEVVEKKVNPALELTPMERLHRFTLLLFCEQTLGKDADEERNALRQKMRALDEDLFDGFLAIIASRKK